MSVSQLVASMDHLNHWWLPWTRLNSLGAEVCPPFRWNAGNTSTFSLLWFSNGLSCIGAGLPCWRDSFPLDAAFYYHTGKAAEGKDGSRPQGMGLLHVSLAFSAVKSMKWTQRTSVARPCMLAASSGSTLRLGMVWMEAGAPSGSLNLLGNLLLTNPSITLWHQKMFPQSRVEAHDNEFMGGKLCWGCIYLVSNLSSLNTAP